MLLEHGILCLDSEMSLPSDPVLIGHAFHDDSVIFGTDAFRRYAATKRRSSACTEHVPRPLEGRFLIVRPTVDGLAVGTDCSGQETLYIYREAGYWALSNSLLGLAEQVADRGRRPELNVDAIQCFAWNQGYHLAEQPLSHATLVHGIELVPAEQEVLISGDPREIEIREVDGARWENVAASDYGEVLAHYAGRAISRMQSIVNLPQGGPTFELSGGFDSRIVLGLTLRGDVDPSRIRVESIPRQAADFHIAEKIADHVDVALHPWKESARVATLPEQFRFWEYASVGAYLPIRRCALHRPCLDSDARVSGHGVLGSGWKFFRRPAKQVEDRMRARSLTRKSGEAVVREFRRGGRHLGVEAHAPEFPVLHYAAYRARFHCGRNWYRDLMRARAITPLFSRSLLSLEASAMRRECHGAQVVADLGMMVCPELMAFDPEKENKKIPSDVMEEARRYRGKNLTIRELDVWQSDEADEAGDGIAGWANEDAYAHSFGERLIAEVSRSKDNPAVKATLPRALRDEACKEPDSSAPLVHHYRAHAAVYFVARIARVLDAKPQRLWRRVWNFTKSASAWGLDKNREGY